MSGSTPRSDSEQRPGSSKRSAGRLIELASHEPAENMAIDQALLESVDDSGEPVLRLYRWSEPTLSIGYFQSLSDRAEHLESAGARCLRRATGGGAILHHHELTYSLVVPVSPRHSGPRMNLYQQTHLAMSRALRGFGIRAVPYSTLVDRSISAKQSVQQMQTEGPFLCFQRRTDEDLIVSGYKVLGSAQRKSRRAVLQHGSLLLQASEFAPQLPGITDLTSRAVPIDAMGHGFLEELAAAISVDWNPGQLQAPEESRALEIREERFANANWLQKRS